MVGEQKDLYRVVGAVSVSVRNHALTVRELLLQYGVENLPERVAPR